MRPGTTPDRWRFRAFAFESDFDFVFGKTDSLPLETEDSLLPPPKSSNLNRAKRPRFLARMCLVQRKLLQPGRQLLRRPLKAFASIGRSRVVAGRNVWFRAPGNGCARIMLHVTGTWHAPFISASAPTELSSENFCRPAGAREHAPTSPLPRVQLHQCAFCDNTHNVCCPRLERAGGEHAVRRGGRLVPARCGAAICARAQSGDVHVRPHYGWRYVPPPTFRLRRYPCLSCLSPSCRFCRKAAGRPKKHSC